MLSFMGQGQLGKLEKIGYICLLEKNLRNSSQVIPLQIHFFGMDLPGAYEIRNYSIRKYNEYQSLNNQQNTHLTSIKLN